MSKGGQFVIVLGIDPGLVCGWAALDHDATLLDCGVIIAKKGKGVGDLQRRVRQVVHDLWLATPFCDVPVLEWPAASIRGGRRIENTRTYAVAGAILGHFHTEQSGSHLLTPVPVTWRKALGARKGKERDIHAEIERTYEVAKRVGKTKAPHVRDAIGLALYGLKMHDLPETAKEAR